MDELDQLVTPKQDVVYNFFNWPTLVGSKLVVIAVANTMDLPERVMTGRVRSRLGEFQFCFLSISRCQSIHIGMIRINFQPYLREQLEKIVEARLASAKDGLEEEEGASKVVIAPDAIKLASMTVSRITGDARRVLDICRFASFPTKMSDCVLITAFPFLSLLIGVQWNSWCRRRAQSKLHISGRLFKFCKIAPQLHFSEI